IRDNVLFASLLESDKWKDRVPASPPSSTPLLKLVFSVQMTLVSLRRMRQRLSFHLAPHDRSRLKRLVADRNTPVKVVWRARIVLATAEGLGTNAIMRRTGKSKPCVWRWQERYIAEGVDGLLRDKTRPPGKKPLLHHIALKVPKSAPQWSMRSMGKD